MTLPENLSHDLAAFRAALEEGHGTVPATGPGRPFAAATDVSGGAGLVRALRLELTDPAPLADLESELGPARRTPRSGPGRPVRWVFTDTLPTDDASGVTVLAETDAQDDGNNVAQLLLRLDA